MIKQFMANVLMKVADSLTGVEYSPAGLNGRNPALVRKLDKLLTAEVNAIDDVAYDAGVNTRIDITKLRFSDKWGFVRYTFTRTDQVRKIRALADDIEVLLNDMRSEYENPPESRIEVSFGAGLSFDVPYPLEYTPPDWNDAQKRLVGLQPFQALAGIDYSRAPTRPVVLDYLRGLSHTMISGATGSGKTTVAINVLLSLALSTPPDQAHFLFVSTKVSPEHIDIARLPHVTMHRTARECLDAIAAVNSENDRREFAPDKRKVFLVIDEYANLQRQVSARVLAGEIAKVEAELMDLHTGSIAESGRSRGIHIIAITQKAVVEIVDTVFKGNMPTRIGCKTMTKAEDQVAMGDVDAPCHTLSERGSFYVSLNGERPALARCFNIQPDQLPDAVDEINDKWRNVEPYQINMIEREPVTAGATLRIKTEDERNTEKILEQYKPSDLFDESGEVRHGIKKVVRELLLGDDAKDNGTSQRVVNQALGMVRKVTTTVIG